MTRSFSTSEDTLSIRQAERAGAAHALGAKLAHDLGTPLNVILGRASLVADDPETPDEVRSHVEIIAKQARNIRQALDAHMATIRRPHEGTKRVSQPLAPIARAAAELAVPPEVELTLQLDDALVAPLDRTLALQALIATLDHALAVAVEGASVALSIDIVEVERPAARRCARGLYARFVTTVELREGSDPEDDPMLARAAAEGGLRALGGYLGVEREGDQARYEACVPAVA